MTLSGDFSTAGYVIAEDEVFSIAGYEVPEDEVNKMTLLIALLLILAIDYAILAAIIYAICWCLSIVFTWKLALGMWLIIIVIKLCFIRKQ